MTSLIANIIPWAGPRFALGVIGLLLMIIVIGGPAGAVWFHMRGEMYSLRTQINAEWKEKLAKAEKDYAELAQYAAEEAERADTPVTNADVERMCREHPTTCRDSGNIKN